MLRAKLLLLNAVSRYPDAGVSSHYTEDAHDRQCRESTHAGHWMVMRAGVLRTVATCS
jgi:hypothetical protein